MLSPSEIEDFQNVMLEVVKTDSSHFRKVFWPMLVPGAEEHLPQGLRFDGWVDDVVDDEGMRCARIIIGLEL